MADKVANMVVDKVVDKLAYKVADEVRQCGHQHGSHGLSARRA